MSHFFPTRRWSEGLRSALGPCFALSFGGALSLGASLSLGAAATVSYAQHPPAATQSATQSLLDKADALESRGRMDMATQTWQQVLLADPNNTEALGGLARAAKLAGNNSLAATYLDRLRAINPRDPNIDRVQGMLSRQSQSSQLAEAGRYAQGGDYARAMAIYRQVFGNEPPPGDWALAYYETEAATENGRAHAIAGLRALMASHPADARYPVSLGRILTYNPRTRAEGRRLLERHPEDPHAVEALRQSLLWDEKSPASAGDIRTYLTHHPDAELAEALRNMPKLARPLTPQQVAANAQLTAAYRALNAKRLPEAEQRLREILDRDPTDARALAGLGYVRMQQSNFPGAISFFEQAEQEGAHDPALSAALVNARFYATTSQGAAALNANDLATAERRYQAALAMHPDSPDALAGLGGTLLKAQQPEVAAQVFTRFTKVSPSNPAAWRGLFLAQSGSGNAAQALETERRIPPAVHAQLLRDPDFLRALASTYTAAGRDADAQRVLRIALDLPFPADARGLKAETQLQYAGLLEQANRLDQAAGLYRQVLAADPNNPSAWEGLVRAEHALKHDAEALETLQSMPPGTYGQAMRDPGFATTVASIYQAQNKLDIAQGILERSVAQQTAAGQRPAVGVQLQLAGIYLAQNNGRQAFPLYGQILSANPANTDAWKGLISILHSTGRDQEALAEIRQIPPDTRRALEDDVQYLQAVGNIYNGLGQPREAMVFLNRVQQHYGAQNRYAPADVDIQNAYLLFNGNNDPILYRQLMVLGSRSDLTSEQRRTVQTIWSLWAVRRANQAAAAGNNRRALAILNAAAQSFPDNPAVLRALANGYARAGLPKQAVAIYKAQDLTSASAADYRGAIGAALAANDLKDAETWLRYALDQYPRDAQMLILGAKFEQARGDSRRAANYYRASLSAMPPPDPGAELANELSRPMPSPTVLPGGATIRSSQDLATLLAPGSAEASAPEPPVDAVPARPYLPSYDNAYGTAPVQINSQNNGQNGGQNNGAQSSMSSAVPSYMTAPDSSSMAAPDPYPAVASTPRPQSRPFSGPSNRAGTTLKDYVPPQPSQPQDLLYPQLPESGSYTPPAAPQPIEPAYAPQSYPQPSEPGPSIPGSGDGSLPSMPQTGSQAGDQPRDQSSVSYPDAAQAYQHQPIQQRAQQAQAQPQDRALPPGPLTDHPSDAASQQPIGTLAGPGSSDVIYGAYVPYTPPAPAPVNPPQSSVATDVLPTASYLPNARHRSKAAAPSRRSPSSPVLMGQSTPPAEDDAPTQNAQYNAAQSQYQAQAQAQSQQQGIPDSGAQQYPQPATPPATSPATAAHRRARTTPSPRGSYLPALPQSNSADQPGLLYPGVPQPLEASPYVPPAPALAARPAPEATAPGAPPSDADLVSRSVPALRGGYHPGNTAAVGPPISQREQTELELASLEGSYSGWIGGTAYARYRSGVPGIDRFTDLEAPVEASVANPTARFTIVTRPVFLSNGVINTASFQGLTGIIPVLGTLPANAVATPAQQYASGVGGELQVTTANFGAAVGYTPYGFLVSNATGHLRWRPAGGHLTLFADRDAVKETQLSYAGLHDPGSATAFSPGNIWGGVIATGGGARLDVGGERSGLYLVGQGASLTGYHVLANTRFEGTLGAYFRVKVIPNYGSLNIGGAFFGLHYKQNELGLTYGNGGYFSPQSYFLAAVPVTFTGHYRTDLHYTIAGAVGVQTFQSASAPYYPLDRAIQTDSNNPYTPLTTSTGLNYAVNSELAYRIADHWYGGGFVSGNNTNNYNTISGGFFLRYLFRPQVSTETAPTGLFPLEGFRPVRVP